MTNTNTIKLSPDEKSTIRKALLAAGIKTRGMDDQTLVDTRNALNKSTQSSTDPVYIPDNQLDPVTTPDPVAKAPKKPRTSRKKKTNGSGPDQAAPDTAQQKPVQAPTDPITTAITSVVNDIMENLTPALDEKAITDLIEKHSLAPRTSITNIQITSPDNTKHTIQGAHPMLADLLDVFSVNENAYLVGPAGCGKTMLAVQAAEALKTSFYSTGAVSDKFELIGFVDAAGKYHRTPLREVVEFGGVFLWDEIDASLPAALVFFNDMLERKYITFPDGKEFAIDPDKTKFVAAANTVGTGATRAYVGRFELDRATLDRYTQLDMDYDRAIELDMAATAWLANGGDPEKVTTAGAWAEQVIEFRELLNKRNILALCTPRATRRGAAYLAKGWPISKVKKAELYRHLSADQLKQLGV